jgi:hypothetical protein
LGSRRRFLGRTARSASLRRFAINSIAKSSDRSSASQ